MSRNPVSQPRAILFREPARCRSGVRPSSTLLPPLLTVWTEVLSCFSTSFHSSLPYALWLLTDTAVLITVCGLLFADFILRGLRRAREHMQGSRGSDTNHKE